MFELFRNLGLFVVVAMISLLCLRYVFDTRIQFDTPARRRARRAKERSYEKVIHDAQREALEQVINNQAEKIQKDFQKTLTNMDTYVNTHLKQALDKELKLHANTTEAVKSKALETIQKSSELFARQQKEVKQAIDTGVEQTKAVLIRQVEGNLANVVRAYVKAALKDNGDVDEQIESVILQLERDKAKIVRDMADELI